MTARVGGEGADGIGSGTGSNSGNFATDRTAGGKTVPGKAIIYTDSIADTNTGDWDGIVFQWGEGQVYGEAIRLSNGLVLEDG